MAQAYILKSGIIVQDDWTDVKYSVNTGFVVSFKKNGKKFVSVNRKDFKSNDKFLPGGYWYEDDFLKYLALSSYKLNINSKYDFIQNSNPAKDGDQIVVKKLEIIEDSGNYTPWLVSYTFDFDSTKNYIKFLGFTPIVQSIILPSDAALTYLFALTNNTANEFYLTNKYQYVDLIPTLSEEEKIEIITNIALSAIVIANIDTQIFDAYFNQPPFDVISQEQKDEWETEPMFSGTPVPIENFKSYLSDINRLYSVLKINGYKIQIADNDEKYVWLCSSLSSKRLSYFTPEIRKQVILDLINKDFLSTIFEKDAWEDMLLRLIDSFSQHIVEGGASNIQKVEDFIGWLANYSLISGETEADEGRITLFELLYKRMSSTLNITRGFIELNNAVFNSNSPITNTRDKFIQLLYTLWSYTKFNPYDENDNLKDFTIGYKQLQPQLPVQDQIAPFSQPAGNYVFYYSHMPGYETYPASEEPTCGSTCYNTVFYRDASYSQEAAPITISYRSDKLFGFYLDNFNFSLEGSKILAFEKGLPVSFDEDYGDDGTTIYRNLLYGTYDLLQPLTMIDTGIDTATPIPYIDAQSGEINSLVPAFVLYHIDKTGSNSNIETFVGLLVDGVLTFSGVGNLAKLRHLRWFGGGLSIMSWQGARIIVGGLEVSIGVVDFFANLVECQPNDETCKQIKNFINLLALSFGSIEIGAHLQLQRYAKRIMREVNGNPVVLRNKFDDIDGANTSPATKDEAVSTIGQFAENATDLSQRLLRFSERFNLDTAQVNVLTSNLNSTDQDIFIFAFNEANRPDVVGMLRPDGVLLDKWVAIKDFPNINSNRMIVEGLEDYTTDNLTVFKNELSSNSGGETFRDLLLRYPEETGTLVKKIIQDPDEALQYAKYYEDDPQWYRWVRTRFFKYVTRIGRQFEKNIVTSGLEKRLGSVFNPVQSKILIETGKDINNNYQFYNNVQLYFNDANYFVADQMFVKWGFDDFDNKIIEDIIILETKLQQGTNLSTRQTQFLQSLQNGGFERLKVRNVDREGKYNLVDNAILLQNDELRPNSISLFKLYDFTDGTAINDLEKLF
ncbi:hypothetical protein [Luteirhabdus pelagi]|uniref:hypothetical protein n=1 Tax=Luteirhabdus pelagi TaxID=2792783 RepID=UPI00193AAD5A|nr:hypothetical protein [Luteirhabdus pelagi]